MNEKVGTMKSEEEDEAMVCSELPPSSEMTLKKNEDCSSPYMDQTPEIMETKFTPPLPTKFDGINLEDDIEKVEVTSHESSSEESEDEVPKVIPNNFLEQNPTDSLKNWLQKLSETEPMKSVPTPLKSNESVTKNLVQNPSRVVKYQDLPYMGEMTLDNSKPRRGRKPKKADICHLIYKNYGTIFPGTPNPKTYTDSTSMKKPSDDLKSDVQNRIISSLLEKRLTQEKKDKALNKNQHEPLNLCIRDLNHLKIRLLKNNDNTYTSEIKSEPPSDDDVEFVHETPSPSIKNELDCLSSSSPDSPKTPDNPNGFVYWPNTGVFIHPMALQQQLMMYQRLASNNNFSLPKPPTLIDHKPAIEPAQELRKIVPKIKVKKLETNDDAEVVQKSKRTASSASEKTPTKRKRSAIFIPPIQTENTSNPATEVSICKFKFTGGAKPSLQEKKMLSVDSGGNFRYYSGTGDKSMRGYEFFPRETLQQQANNNQGSSTGAFLQASGEKIYPVPPVDFPQSKTALDFQLNPETSQVSLQPHPENSRNSSNKKRKSRKSVQRENLEKTFKEKGFLIQTQQLESAEGATYCKFRQLRKFTRYLFRSWKDYLPGNVGDNPEGERPEHLMVDQGEHDIDNLSVHSSDLSSSNVQC